MLNLPFDPVKRAQEVESVVTKGMSRRYHRFRPAPYYGGIATADAVGCCFLCAYCWSYYRIIQPQKHGKFFSSEEVADILLKIARGEKFKYVRITGCEPILGENSFEHLISVIDIVLTNNPNITFMLETNGLFLGYSQDFIERLKFSRLSVRVALKGWDEESFQRISGADKKFFNYPLLGLKKMIDSGIDAWPAVMLDIFGRSGVDKLRAKLLNMGLNCQIETEMLERYPYVMENIAKRGVPLKE